MLPPPTTAATCTPSFTAAMISAARWATTSGEMPRGSAPANSPPDSFSTTRRQLGWSTPAGPSSTAAARPQPFLLYSSTVLLSHHAAALQQLLEPVADNHKLTNVNDSPISSATYNLTDRALTDHDAVGERSSSWSHAHIDRRQPVGRGCAGSSQAAISRGISERLVHQDERRLDDDGACDGDALLLSPQSSPADSGCAR